MGGPKQAGPKRFDVGWQFFAFHRLLLSFHVNDEMTPSGVVRQSAHKVAMCSPINLHSWRSRRLHATDGLVFTLPT
jgi:hypothetical protein